MSDETKRNEEEAPDSEPEKQSRKRVSRRGLFRAGAATGLTAAGAYAAVLPGVRHDGADAAPAPAAVIPVADVHQMASVPATANDLAGYTFFNPLMVDVVAAAADRMIPKDDNGPGALDAGVDYFIDRQLSSEYGVAGKRYAAGPFGAGVPTQGDQLALPMRERYRQGVDGMQAYAQQLFQQNFKDLSTGQQEQILHDMEAGKATGFNGLSGQQFFQLLLSHVKAGFFADPIYGGNRDMAGWKLIGYPGAQIVYADWIGKYGQKFTGPYMSLADHQEALHQSQNGGAMAGMAAMTAPAATAAPAAMTAPTAATANQAAAGPTMVNVIMKDYSFAFDVSMIPAGMVTFNLVNQGMAPHNLSFPSLNMTSMTIRAGQTTQFTVNLPAGMYDYLCTIPGHAEAGMKGTLTIAGAPAAAASNQAAGGGTPVNVVLKEYSFAFDKSMIPAGMVTFNLVNQGTFPHDLSFPSLNMTSMMIRPGQMTQFTVNLPAGTYDYLCTIPGHADRGMKGTLTIQ